MNAEEFLRRFDNGEEFSANELFAISENSEKMHEYKYTGDGKSTLFKKIVKIGDRTFVFNYKIASWFTPDGLQSKAIYEQPKEVFLKKEEMVVYRYTCENPYGDRLPLQFQFDVPKSTED